MGKLKLPKAAVMGNVPEKTEKPVSAVEPDMRLRPLTADEQAIAARVAATDNDWQTITEESLGDFSLMSDPYPLPKEAQEAMDRKLFAFRFIAKTPDRIDEVRNAQVPMRWWICNRDTTPFLAKYCDPVHGAIQVKDQILVFKPYWMFEKHQAAKMDIANMRDQAGDLKNKAGFEQDGKVEWKTGAVAQARQNEVVTEVENIGEVIEE